MEIQENNCEICSYEINKIIFNKGKVGKFGQYGNLNIIQCQKCGHIYQDKKRDLHDNNEFFKEEYHHLNSHYQNNNSAIDSQVSRSKGILAYLSKHHPMNKNLLDLGCGYGYVMKSFIEAGYDCYGIDPDKSCIDYTQKKSNLNVILGSSEELPYQNDKFDIVLSLGTLEHVSDLTQSLKEIRRVLKDDGVLFLRMRSNRIWGLPYEYFNISTLRYFSLETQLLSLYLNGFDSHQVTHQQLEGRNGDIYISIKKTHNPKPELESLMTKGFYDKPGELTKYLKKHYLDLLSKSQELVRMLGENNENLNSVAKKINRGEYKYPLFTGYTDTEAALLRGAKEAHITIKEPWI